MPTSNWSAVTFGNGLFIALVAGSSLYSYTSTDGLTWTKRNMGASVSWTAVAYGNGVFVAIASGTTTMATSPDGINWTTHVMPVSTSWKLLAFGNGVFVAMANNTSIAATSPDGVTWTQRAIAGSANWYAMTYGNGLFVAVTFGNLVSATSPDGVTWTLGSKLPLSGNWSGIACGNGVFVATGSVGMAISTDGINWTGFPTPYMSSAYTVVFCNGYFAAFGTGYLSITSEDGSHWSKHILSASIVANCSAALASSLPYQTQHSSMAFPLTGRVTATTPVPSLSSLTSTRWMAVSASSKLT
ncbi:hypothetical protein GKE73_16995 [Paludibacterium sp. dN 18-1]|uniref:Uncharacterized protein n=1 Tax=Paludibacterium denitrificans TaxID=2675226 RepID=A0A844GC50_9NEIS|nr:hypothetical protein [Paludibacterium denitrificans]